MSANANTLTAESLLARQDAQSARQDQQFSEIRQELRDLTKITKENALMHKDLLVVLNESSMESRHTRKDLERIEVRVKDLEDGQELHGAQLTEKKANQKLIVLIYSTILAGMFTFFGWLFGKG